MRKLLFVALCELISLCAFCIDNPIQSIEDLVTFCTDQNELGISYPAGTSDETAFPYPNGCLGTTPSPQFFIMQIDHPGDLGIYISHSEGQDIDFACFGPFKGKNKKDVFDYIAKNPDDLYVDPMSGETIEIPSTLDCYANFPEYKKIVDSLEQLSNEADYFYETAVKKCEDSLTALYPDEDWWDLYWDIDECAEDKYRQSPYWGIEYVYPDDPIMFDVTNPCFRGKWDSYPLNMMVDCSYSTNSQEMCYIPNTKEGEWYVLLITNYSMMPGDISFNKTYGEATTNCSIIVDAYTTGPYCEGDDIKLGVNNAPSGATFSWIGPNGFHSSEHNPVIPNATSDMSGIYSVVMISNGTTSPEVEVEVVVNKPKKVEINESITAGEYFLFGGKRFTTAGTYTETFQSVETGCDSIVTLNLSLEGVDPKILHKSPYCEGDNITLEVLNAPAGATLSWEGPNGFSKTGKSVSIANVTPDNAGEYTVTMTVSGEVTTASADIKVLKKKEVAINESIIAGDYYLFGGKKYYTAGTYTETFQSVETGCDSIVTLTLRLDGIEPKISHNGPYCEGETISMEVTNAPNGATISWEGPNGFSKTGKSVSIANATPDNSGEYTVTVSIYGEETSASTGIEVFAKKKTSISEEIEPGDSYTFGDQTLYQAGTYTHTFKSKENGCDSTVTLVLTIKPLEEMIISDNGPLCEGETLVLNLDNAPDNATFLWSGPNNFSSTEQNPSISQVKVGNKGTYSVKIKINQFETDGPSTNVVVNPIKRSSQEVEIPEGETYLFDEMEITQPGTYQQVYNASNGCDSIVTINLSYSIKHYPILIPEEIITPNGDGTFDKWYIKNVEAYERVTAYIYDRFGKLILKIENYNNEDAAWDGKDSYGQNLPSTDYWYLIYAPEDDKYYRGHVSLIR